MKLKNFRIDEDLIGINIESGYLDIHNCYLFDSYHNDIEKQVVSLEWTASQEFAPTHYPKTVELHFNAVSYFEVRKNNPNYNHPEDRSVLMEFGFFENQTLGKVEYNGKNMPNPNESILVLRFEDTTDLAIKSDYVECVIKK